MPDASKSSKNDPASRLVTDKPGAEGIALVRVHRSKGDYCDEVVVALFHTPADAEEYCRLKGITLRSFGGWPDWDEYDLRPVR